MSSSSSQATAAAEREDHDKVLQLLDHQVEALAWSAHRESHPHRGVRGGIGYLEMGLGKTIIGLSVCKDGCNLVVVPKGLLNTWKSEAEKYFPQLKVIYYHKDMIGERRYLNMTYEELSSARVVITTYEVIQGVDRKSHHSESDVICVRGQGLMEGKIVEMRCRRELAEDKTARGEILMYRKKWDRIMIDEGHKICNYKTKNFRALMAVYAPVRYVLSGTIIRNKDTDLWSLLRFCGYNGTPSARDWSEDVYRRDQLEKVVLHMNYKDANIQLPARHVHNITYQFSPEEQRAYDTIKAAVIRAYNGMMLGNIQFMYVLALFTRLRQICIAPHLITPEAKRSYRPTDSPVDEQADRELNEATQGLQTWIHDRYSNAGTKSAKNNALIEVIRGIPADEKIIVFSTWTSALDLAEEAVMEAFGATRGDVVEAAGAGAPPPPPPVAAASAVAPVAAASAAVAPGGPSPEPGEEADELAEQLDTLDIGEQPLPELPEEEEEGQIAPFTTVMLDGDTGTKERKRVVEIFMNDPKCRVLFANSKTAGEGLTLIRANHAVQIEPWWSQAVHDQNFSRIWRYPQQRECHLYNLNAEKSIETEMVLEICRRKIEIKDRFFGDQRQVEGDAQPGKAPGMNKELMGRMLGVRR